MDILIYIGVAVIALGLLIYFSSPKLRYRGKNDRRKAQRREVNDRRLNKRGRRRHTEAGHEEHRKNFNDRRSGSQTRRHHLRREEDRDG
jgi:hypothetical protein